jgi:Kef-type K+ transport system membrane component KefB
MGVFVPLLMVIGPYYLMGRPMGSDLLVGSAMAVTSIAISIRTLEEINQIHSEEAGIINALIIFG